MKEEENIICMKEGSASEMLNNSCFPPTTQENEVQDTQGHDKDCSLNSNSVQEMEDQDLSVKNSVQEMEDQDLSVKNLEETSGREEDDQDFDPESLVSETAFWHVSCILYCY